MHLGIVTHSVDVGDGQAHVNRELARYALARGHRVTLVADRVDPAVLAEGAEWVPVHPPVSRPHLLKVPLFALEADRALAALRPRPDVVLANGFVLWRGSADVNVVHFVHEAWRGSPVHAARLQRGPRAWYQSAYTTLNARWERRAFRQARVIVAVSALIEAELGAAGVDPGRVHAIANGVDPEAFRPGRADRSVLGLVEAVPLALFVGDIKTPRKNLDGVLRALARVPGLHLAVVGTVEGSPYPRMAAELGVRERVRFLGFRRDVADLMRAADLLVFPSRYEPFSLVVLEAMASGLPIVTARTVGAAALVSPEAGIVLDDPDDGDALAQALGVLAADGALRERMGEAARAVAVEHGWDRMASAYLRLCSRLLSAHEAPAPVQ